MFSFGRVKNEKRPLAAGRLYRRTGMRLAPEEAHAPPNSPVVGVIRIVVIDVHENLGVSDQHVWIIEGFGVDVCKFLLKNRNCG